MGVIEIASRSRQAVRRRLEHAGLVRVALAGPEDLPAALAIFRSRFFEGAVDPRPPAQLTGAARERVVARADRLLDGGLDVLGYHGLSIAEPIDWRLDPTTGARAGEVHWSRIDVADPVPGGDAKVIWELNRHQWLVTLGQAYRLTGGGRYARAFAGAMEHWLRENPAGRGINWASSLEVAFRLIAWCWALALFDGAAELTPALTGRIVAGIATHAGHVARHLSSFSSPNTHLTGEALGLVYAGALWPTLPRAAAWRRLGVRILVAEADTQVLPDGVYFEQSTCYQRYTVDFYLHFLLLARRAGIAVPDSVCASVHRMLDFLLAMRRPDGSVPQVGDADGGRLLALEAEGPEDYAATFSTAAAVLGRADCAWAAGGPSPETAWLVGDDAGAVVEPAPPTGPCSRLFREGGYAVMRSGWDEAAQHLVFDVGPRIPTVRSGHDHADLLSVQCSAHGQPFIVDPGTYRYAVETDWRSHFRDTSAHSTLTIDGAGQAQPVGRFGWQARAPARLRAWTSTDRLDYADACHAGYARLQRGLVHRRRVLYVKPRYWVVVDDVEGSGEHAVDLRFQFMPLELTLDAARCARARGRRGALVVRAVASVPLKAEVCEGSVWPIRGWVSTDYGQRVPAPVLVYSAVGTLPLRIVTLLWPTAHPDAAAPLLEPVVVAGELVGVQLPDGARVRVTAERLELDGPVTGRERG